jgi:hypothetical protein
MKWSSRARRVSKRVLVPLALGLVVGCAPTSPSSGCGSGPQRATDAAFSGAALRSNAPPCSFSPEVPRGSDAHLIVSFTCPGESDRFLAAVKVDGELKLLQAVRGAGDASLIMLDAGSWEAPDTVWHDVEVVLDPLNLFKESDESNNRGSARIRIIDPDAALLEPECGFTVPQEAGGNGWSLVSEVQSGTPVDVRLRFDFGGPYAGIRCSVLWGSSLAAADTLSIPACNQITYFTSTFITRWVPPGPGVYDVEFRIEPLGGTPDPNSTNNVLTKRLTVMAAANPPLRALARKL